MLNILPTGALAGDRHAVKESNAMSEEFYPMPLMTNIETNKAIAQRFLELVSEHKMTELCDMVSPNWRMHGGPPKLSPGSDGIRELFSTFGAIEQQWIVEDVIAEGDKVVVRATNLCRQESFLGIPAHHRQQRFTATFIHHITNGKIVETWRNADDLGRMLQLGARIESVSA
jgi:predicted ester cyclase